MKKVNNSEKKPLRYRLLYRLVKLFSPKYSLEGTENISGGPVVIVGNHCQMYGPIAGEMYMPRDHYVWCVHEMMDRKEAPEYSFNDFWSEKPKWIRWFYRLLSKGIGPLAELVFSYSHTIPVYHDRRIMDTVRQTLERFEEGCDVVIFPENREKHNTIINEFQHNFVDIARFYHRHTGQILRFVPMYVAPKISTIIFGEPVSFDPEAALESERERICRFLQDSITDLALSKPLHTVVPFENSGKRTYPKSQPLEVYDETHAL